MIVDIRSEDYISISMLLEDTLNILSTPYTLLKTYILLFLLVIVEELELKYCIFGYKFS